jgi:hypothetical protein
MRPFYASEAARARAPRCRPACTAGASRGGATGAGRGGEPFDLLRRQRVQRFLQRGAALHLRHREHAPADGEQVDLAAGRAQAEAENAVTAEHEPERGQPLAAVALAPGGLAAAAAVFTRAVAVIRRPSARGRGGRARGAGGRWPWRPRGGLSGAEPDERLDQGGVRVFGSCGRVLARGRPARRSRPWAGPAPDRRRVGQAAAVEGSRRAWSARGRPRPRGGRRRRPCRRGWRQPRAGLEEDQRARAGASSRASGGAPRSWAAKPAKRKRSVGRPEAASAVRGAEARGWRGPDGRGGGVADELVAGVADQRVPASLTSATRAPSASGPARGGAASSALWSW